jgi:histidinol-phosphate/aromatic aminotransferase/cobyric acid decarboxylase-like protein
MADGLGRMEKLHARFVSGAVPAHGGNLSAEARRLGVKPHALLDASASLVPFRPPRSLQRALSAGIRGSALRDYPDRDQWCLRDAIAGWHGLDPACVLPGNGAAELFTWAARDAAALGCSVLPSPGFADYRRALQCWQAPQRLVSLPVTGLNGPLQSFPLNEGHRSPQDAVLWVTNPHNPTGQLWSRSSLEPLLQRYSLVICDEAFLSLVPDGERQSLLPLVEAHPNLVVIRSLTKVLAVAGLRLGYAVAQPVRLHRWRQWRDPWPVNGMALAAGEAVLADHKGFARWLQQVHHWVERDGAWLAQQLQALPGIAPLPAAANFVLIHSEQSLVPLREALAQRHGVLLRDCRSFEGLGERWLRIGLQNRRGNRRIIRALRQEIARQPLV